MPEETVPPAPSLSPSDDAPTPLVASLADSALLHVPQNDFSPRHSNWVVRAIALFTLGFGLLNFWSALLARGPGRATFLHSTVHLPLVLEHASRTLIALFGLALIMLARSLARHKRQAWRIALLLTLVAPAPHLIKGLDWEEAAICLVMALVLLAFRHAFYAQNDRPSARQGTLAAVFLIGFAVLYGPIGFYLLRREYKPAFTWKRAALQTTNRLIFTPALQPLRPQTRRTRWFDNSLLTISLCATGYGAFMLLRPVLPRTRTLVYDREQARRLLQTFPSDPISYFALLPDKQYHMGGENENWGVAYVLVGRTAVALGDPFGDPLQAREAIASFCQLCRSHDWSPAFYQTTGRYLKQYQKHKLRALKIGEDAVLLLATWSMKGKPFQDLRTAINKMGKTGIAFEAFAPESSQAADTLTQMDAISEAWLLAHKGEEKTFGLGRFEPHSDLFSDSRFFVARQTETDRVLAFVSFVPIGTRGWGLDLMRRASDSPNGVMEFLIASATLAFQAEGEEIISLGLSPLSGGDVAEPDESELMVKGRALLYQRFNYFYGFKGLHAFKEKFGPIWEPRYLIYPGDTTLPQTVLSVIRAHSPRGLWSYATSALRK